MQIRLFMQLKLVPEFYETHHILKEKKVIQITKVLENRRR